MFQNVQDVLAARLAILVENEQLEAGEANIAVRAIKTLVENSDAGELMIALENAMWMDKTVLEVGSPVHPAPSEPLGEIWIGDGTGGLRKIREGEENDGLTDAEVEAAMAEQDRPTWPQDDFGREIDPGLMR